MLLVRGIEHTWNSHINVTLFSSLPRLKYSAIKFVEKNLCYQRIDMIERLCVMNTCQIGYVSLKVSFLKFYKNKHIKNV